MAGLTYPMMLGLAVLVIPMFYLLYKRSERFPKLVALSRALILLLLVGAAAQPYVNTDQSISETPEVTILKDESSSTDLLQEENLDFENVNVRERTIASGNTSDLRNGLLRNLDQNTNYLVISDFQSSSPLGGVADRFDRSNATINTIKYDTRRDASVWIDGPSTSVPGAETQFTIKVSSTRQNPTPTVTIDGEEVQPIHSGNGTWRTSRTFESQGSHTVKAELNVNDSFENNNAYHHAIDITEKPEILVIGNKGQLGEKLSEFYDVTYKRSVPEDLSPYYTVITTEDTNDDSLIPYVTEGNGLIHTGEPQDNSLDILPVKKVPKDQQTEAAKILLLVDISARGCTQTQNDNIDDDEEIIAEEETRLGNTQYTVCKKENEVGRSIEVARALVREMPFNTKIGVMHYAEDVYTFNRGTDPVPLEKNRQLLQENLRVRPQLSNSFHHVGLSGAKQVMNGTGNIVMLSDGRITAFGRNENTAQKSKQIASNLEDTRLITVGVGPDRNKEFLRELANRGGGQYLEGENSGRLSFIFAAGGSEGKNTPVVVTNPDHFITSGMELSTSVSDFDRVEAKKGADRLASGTNGNAFLTSWRYGIGRVAAYSGDSEQLDKTVTSDPLLVTRSVAWTVGDPKRKLDEWVRVENERRPNAVEARSSDEREGFKRQREDLYTLEVTPNSTGFGRIEGKYYGYNYEEEYQEVGYRNEMESIVSDTGGEVYSPDEKERLVEDIKNFSEKKIVKQQQLGSYLIAAALLIFLAEVGYRKVNGKK